MTDRDDVRGLLPDLAELRVARPCQESWDAMRGEHHVRHCSRCDKDVFDFTSLTRQQIADLLYVRGAHLCARFYRRADGTIMTADCVDARRLRRHGRAAASVAAAAIAGATAAPSIADSLRPETIARHYAPPPEPDHAYLVPDDDERMTLGAIAVTSLPPPPVPLPKPLPDPLAWREPDVKPATEPARISTTFSGVPARIMEE